MKPMLAATCKDMSKLKFPAYASPKLDGVRALKIGKKLLSRKLKEIPNEYVKKIFANLPEGLDGELIMGVPTAKGACRNTVSAVMRHTGECKNIMYYVFDDFKAKGGFELRICNLQTLEAKFKNVKVVPQKLVYTLAELIAYEKDLLRWGYEGVMLRAVSSPYKQGRSTLREGYLIKVKKFVDDEALVLGTYERMHNTNEAKKNKLGHTERSTAKAGKKPMGQLGGFFARGKDGVEFKIGGFLGFTNEDRIKMWKEKDSLVGKWAKFRHFPYGKKTKPRLPIFIGFRDPIDM